MMHVVPYLNEWSLLYNRALERISSYDSSLYEKAALYLTKSLSPRDPESKNVISYLLPYWINEHAGLSNGTCSKIALACSFGMISFMIQDDIMDQDAALTKADIVLSQLFAHEMHRLFNELFESQSPFWLYYGRYMREWADGALNEAECDYYAESPLSVAKKASLVKLGGTAVLLLANRARLIPDAEKAVEWTLVTLQMSDDWLDWNDDLASGSYNCLLAQIRRASHSEDPLTATTVKNHIFVRNTLEAYADQAERNLHHARAAFPEAAVLHAYHQSLADGLRAAAALVSAKRKSLLTGGFYYLLRRSTKT